MPRSLHGQRTKDDTRPSAHRHGYYERWRFRTSHPFRASHSPKPSFLYFGVVMIIITLIAIGTRCAENRSRSLYHSAGRAAAQK